MTAVFLAGGVAGLGLFLLILVVLPRRLTLARRVAEFDAARQAAARPEAGAAAGPGNEISRWLGDAVARVCARQGWEFPSTRADLALVGTSFESFVASKVLLALLGLVLAPALAAMAAAGGVRISLVIPLWLGLVLALVFFLLPDAEMRRKATRLRRDFRHAMGAFLDLVAMNLSGGRGVPEALMTASEIGGGWAMWRIRDAMVNARLTGQTPWQALGALGEELRVDELRDLSSALGLVAEDGAKVRESLTSRAASLRRRELAEMQGQAGERSQSMLVAQLLLAIAFLVFLIYPATRLLLGT